MDVGWCYCNSETDTLCMPYYAAAKNSTTAPPETTAITNTTSNYWWMMNVAAGAGIVWARRRIHLRTGHPITYKNLIVDHFLITLTILLNKIQWAIRVISFHLFEDWKSDQCSLWMWSVKSIKNNYLKQNEQARNSTYEIWYQSVWVTIACIGLGTALSENQTNVWGS